MRALILCAFFSLAACTDVGAGVSPSVRNDPPNQDRAIQALLDQYDQAYRASGHPKVGPTSIFMGTGDRAFEPILDRIHDESDFNRYSRILAELDHSGDLDICNTRYLERLAERLRATGGITRTPYPVRYSNCRLPETVYRESR